MSRKKYKTPVVTSLRVDKSLINFAHKIGAEFGELFILGLINHVKNQVDGGKLSKENQDELNLIISDLLAHQNKPKKYNGSRFTPEFRAWAGAVKFRDGMRCVSCGSKSHIEAHHIIPVSIRPDLIFDLSNGVSLCKSCHIKVHTLGIDPLLCDLSGVEVDEL